MTVYCALSLARSQEFELIFYSTFVFLSPSEEEEEEEEQQAEGK
jgi:hypothetical protein